MEIKRPVKLIVLLLWTIILTEAKPVEDEAEISHISPSDSTLLKFTVDKLDEKTTILNHSSHLTSTSNNNSKPSVIGEDEENNEGKEFDNETGSPASDPGTPTTVAVPGDPGSTSSPLNIGEDKKRKSLKRVKRNRTRIRYSRNKGIQRDY